LKPSSSLCFLESTWGVKSSSQTSKDHNQERSTTSDGIDGDEDPTSIVASSGPPSELDTNKPKLRPLTSLNWPYIPEESAFPDPLKRDDPKDLQLRQYEAIGMFTRPIHISRNTSSTHSYLI